jgi:hypothetical protein
MQLANTIKTLPTAKRLGTKTIFPFARISDLFLILAPELTQLKILDRSDMWIFRKEPLRFIA